MKEPFLSSAGRLSRPVFALRLVLLLLLAGATSLVAVDFFARFHDGVLLPLGYFIGIVASLFCALAILMQFLKRLHDLEKPPYWALLLLLPPVNLAVLLYAVCAPPKQGDAAEAA